MLKGVRMRFSFRHYFNQRTLTFLAILSMTLTVACTTSPSSSKSSAPTTSITGNGMLGPIAGATVAAYAVNPTTGAADTSSLLGTTTTDSNGNYTMTVSVSSGPVVIQLTGGSYTEEASNNVVQLGSTTYSTILPSIAANAQLNVAVGPLPNMAYQAFVSQVQAGLESGTTIAQLATNVNYQVSQGFGLPDVVGTLPANPLGAIPNDPTGQYALILAAISQAAQSASTPTTSVVLAAALTGSFVSTGSFTALGTGPVSVTDTSGQPVTITPPSLSSLSSTVSQIGSGAAQIFGVNPPSGFTPPTFNPAPPSTAPSGYVPGTPEQSTGSSSAKYSATGWSWDVGCVGKEVRDRRIHGQ